MKRFALVLLTVFLVILGVWHIAIPDTVFSHLFNAALEKRGLHAKLVGIKKGFFLNFDANQLNIEKSGISLVSIGNVHGEIDLLSLLSFRLPFFFSGDIEGGRINIRHDLLRDRDLMNISIDKAEIEGIPLLKTAGITGRGILSGDLKAENNSGEFRFNIINAEFKSASFGGIPIPLEMFSEAKGVLSLKNDLTEVKSLALKGDGIYARITGNITGNSLRINIELMPERSFKEKNPMFSLLEQYKISPGYYRIPISSNLSF